MASKRHARAPTADIIMGWVDPWVWFGLVAEPIPLEDRRRPQETAGDQRKAFRRLFLAKWPPVEKQTQKHSELRADCKNVASSKTRM